MFSRGLHSLSLFLLVTSISSCAERQSPFEPRIAPRTSNSTIVPPIVSGMELPLTDENNPALTLPLPTYANAVIAWVQVQGRVNVVATHGSKSTTLVDASGYRRPEITECHVNVIVTYTSGFWSPGPCGTFPAQLIRADTILVQGQGTVTRGPRVFQWPYECDGDQCWKYSLFDLSQTLSITPLSAALELTTPGTAEVAPGTIEVAPNSWVTFKASPNPTTLKAINVPVRVLFWQWTAASGGPGRTVLTGADTAKQRPVYIAERGSMVVAAIVNGTEQFDTVVVSVPEVKVTPMITIMRPSTLTPAVRDTSWQTITVSVEGITGPLRHKAVSLTLAAVEGTAGHSHTGSKPKGNFLPTGSTILNLNTDSTGVKEIKYQAPDPSGPVKIIGTSSGAVSDTAEVLVAYLGLVELTEGANYLLTGDKPPHPRNHYATEAHIANLKKLADFFFAKFGDRPTFNDSSLELGGLYDIAGTWTYSHKAHRKGRNTDLKTTEPHRTETQRIALWIAWERFGGEVGDETKKKDGTPNTENPHYHLIY